MTSNIRIAYWSKCLAVKRVKSSGTGFDSGFGHGSIERAVGIPGIEPAYSEHTNRRLSICFGSPRYGQMAAVARFDSTTNH